MKPKVILINPKDNVAVALEDLHKGESVSLPDGSELLLVSDIPMSHKVALLDIPADAEVLKYGENIGEAVGTIRRGEWVHTHNLNIKGKAQ